MSDTPATVEIESAGSHVMHRVSMVWLIPLFAVAVALFVAWQSYNERGPLITIEFVNGAGITTDETELRFRNVAVGVVEEVQFSEDLSSVLAKVRLEKEIAPYIDSGASFWVVRPELTPQGVSGLDTVISGVFIEGLWDGTPGPRRTTFKGLSSAPLFRPGQQGLQIALRTVPGGSITESAPILFRGIEVGRIGPARLSQFGNFAIAEAIIDAPYSDLITNNTRFWDTSGFSVSIGPGGAEIDFSSIASLVSGGVTFDTFVSGGRPAVDGTVYEIFPEEIDARNSVFNASEVEVLELRLIFDENISGLALGAPVELSGLSIGSVESLSGIVDADRFGDGRVRLNVVVAIQPARLGLPGDVTPEAALAFLSEQVDGGLRARLASGSLLTGGLKVELAQTDEREQAQMRIRAEDIPQMPTTDSDITDATATVEGVFSRINSLPIEDLLNSAILFMDNAAALVASEDLRETPEELRGLVGDVRGLVTSQDVQAIPQTLNAALVRLDTLLAQIEEQQAVARITRAIDATTEAAETVGASVDGVPDLIAGLRSVTNNVAALPLKDVADELTALLNTAENLIGAPEMRALPASLADALAELSAALAELREGGAVRNVNATLTSAREAADAVALSSRDLPELVDRITEVFDEASATIEGYNQGEVLSRDAQAALRDISEAADAITALVRLLERNPTALIRGR
ncbi:MAG: MlaD family protein [Pseudomonadota bacterium]